MSDELLKRISHAATLLRSGGYELHKPMVEQLVGECTSALAGVESRFGTWEDELMGSAISALNAGWLMLALVSIEKALQVNQLPEEEYRYGHNYGANS